MAHRNKSNVRNVFEHAYGSRLGLFFESIVVGLLVGLVVCVFRLLLEQADHFRQLVYGYLKTATPRWWLLWILLLVVTGLGLGWLSKRYPMIRGSGIPQIKGAMLRKLRLDWWPELPLKIVSSVASIGLGMSLGREGPSVQLGAYVGQGFMRTFRRPLVEREYLMTSGAAAGLAAAFNAPLAGVLFALEELHKYFSPLLIACAMGASVVGDFVASQFFGLRPVFDFPQIQPLGLAYMPLVIGLGFVCAAAAVLFQRLLTLSQSLYDRLRIPQVARPLLPLAVSIPLGLYLIDATGGGHALIEHISRTPFSLQFLLVLLAAKLLFSSLCYGSGVSGGIFLPLLTIGALIGEAYGLSLSTLGWVDEGTKLNFMILGMAGLFSGVVRAPITGTVLILEMSGNLNHFSGLIMCCLSAFIFGYLFKTRPVYDVLLDRLLKRSPGLYEPLPGAKIMVEIPVSTGSGLANRKVCEIPRVRESLIVGIARGDAELVPDGSTEIWPGDRLLVLTSEEKAGEVRELLQTSGEGH